MLADSVPGSGAIGQAHDSQAPCRRVHPGISESFGVNMNKIVMGRHPSPEIIPRKVSCRSLPHQFNSTFSASSCPNAEDDSADITSRSLGPTRS